MRLDEEDRLERRMKGILVLTLILVIGIPLRCAYYRICREDGGSQITCGGWIGKVFDK